MNSCEPGPLVQSVPGAHRSSTLNGLVDFTHSHAASSWRSEVGMPRFVLLEHRWNGVHWDLMLETETGGLLRTWAIDSEVVAGLDLPARELGDHRADYLDYEGEVSGNRGTVRRIDRGEYTTEIWTPGLVRVRLA